MGINGEVSIETSAPPETVYALVSDVTRMGEWSPETVKAVWKGEVSEPAVGAKFRGTNKRTRTWSTTATVIAAEPGREFAFCTGKPEKPQTVWRYRFAPSGAGTKITESFDSTRDPGAFGKWLTKMGTGVTWDERSADLVRSMTETLAHIKSVAESGTPQ